MKKFECRKTPVHILSTGDAKAGSVELCRRPSDRKSSENTGSKTPEAGTLTIEEHIKAPSKSNNPSMSADPGIEDSQNLYEPDSLTKVLSDGSTALPQVLISLSLEEEQLLDLDQCRRWLQQFPALAKWAKVQAVFRSNSTLMILSVPVLIWDWIPDDPACSFIGYVHSLNLLGVEQDKQGSTSQSETSQKQEVQQKSKLPDFYMAQEASSSKSIIADIRSFRDRVTSVGSGSYAWTVHISLLPTRTQPFPFEKDTAAYKRCLSRGLHQMIVVPDSDGYSFKKTIDRAFSVNLRGRQWEPLVAKLCDAEGLRGLPMLRPLPEHLVGSDYNAEFLKHNCAVVDKKGKILDLYIAMSEGTISWAELKEVSPFIPGLEAAWAYDPYLDGIYATEDRINQVTKRYSSNESAMSAKPSRNLQRLQAPINLANALLLRPKSNTGNLQMYQQNLDESRINDPVHNRMPDVAAAPGKPLTVLKPTYVRPKHPVLFCQLCDSHQQGFRGEHELRKHQDREHKPIMKKWICIQPTDPGHYNPVVELSRCKACKRPKKYGAYYNAAAHLRCAHFKPKFKSKHAKLNRKVEDGEKRGGNGGDWPPMSELKFWIKEIEVPVDDDTITSSHPDLAESDDDVFDDMNQMWDQRASPVFSLAPTLVNEPLSSTHFPSSSSNSQLGDFEEPDVLKLDDPAVSTIEDYTFEQTRFVDQSMYG
jgi:hypothetical protein